MLIEGQVTSHKSGKRMRKETIVFSKLGLWPVTKKKRKSKQKYGRWMEVAYLHTGIFLTFLTAFVIINSKLIKIDMTRQI